MRRKTKYKMPHRRRREQKTDYRARLRLLKGGKPRLVIRKTSNNLTCQIISHSPEGDKTLLTCNYLSLKALGWKAHGGSIPSAYLIGFLCGSRAKKLGIKEEDIERLIDEMRV